MQYECHLNQLYGNVIPTVALVFIVESLFIIEVLGELRTSNCESPTILGVPRKFSELASSPFVCCGQAPRPKSLLRNRDKTSWFSPPVSQINTMDIFALSDLCSSCSQVCLRKARKALLVFITNLLSRMTGQQRTRTFSTPCNIL